MEPSVVVLDLSVHQNHWWDYTHTGKTDRSTKAHIMFANFINDSLACIYSRQRMRSKEKWWQFDSYEWRHSIWLEQSFIVRVRDCPSQSPLPPPFMEFPLYVLPETCSLILASIQQASAPPQKKPDSCWNPVGGMDTPSIAHLPHLLGTTVPKQIAVEGTTTNSNKITIHVAIVLYFRKSVFLRSFIYFATTPWGGDNRKITPSICPLRI